MKNANVFGIFILLIFAIYPISIFSYNKSKKFDLSNEPIIITGFSYKIIEKDGSELFMNGNKIEKTLETQIFEKINGYFIDKNKHKYDFVAETGVNNTRENIFVLEKNIRINENSNFLETNKLIFDKSSKLIKSPEKIKVVFNNNIIEGNDLVYNMETKNIKLKNVRGKLWLSKINF